MFTMVVATVVMTLVVFMIMVVSVCVFMCMLIRMMSCIFMVMGLFFSHHVHSFLIAYLQYISIYEYLFIFLTLIIQHKYEKTIIFIKKDRLLTKKNVFGLNYFGNYYCLILT